MALGNVPHRRLEEADRPLDLIRDLGAREHGHPGRCQLDAERHAVDEPADAACMLSFLVAELEAARQRLAGAMAAELAALL